MKLTGIKFLDLKSSKIVKKDNKAYIRDICYDKFMLLYDYFKKRFNYELIFTDLYRTQKEQIAIHRDRQLHPEKGKAGRPCLSPHLYGHAFDVATSLFKGFSHLYFVNCAISYGFLNISNENWHFQFMTQKGNNFMDEIYHICKPYLPMTGEEIYNHLDFAGYSKNVNGIKKFQSDFGLSVDGIAGQQTQICLLLYNTNYIYK